jgi:predicted nucleic acid-binding protein
MLVVSITSPISNLAIIGRLNLLRGQFREIRSPGAVQAELDRLSHPVALNVPETSRHSSDGTNHNAEEDRW